MGVLDDMTKGITERKAKAAGPRLTPVGTEASPTKPSQLTLPELKGDIFPYDGGIGETARSSIQNIRESLSVITQYGGQIEECLQSIEREAGITVGGPPKRDLFANPKALAEKKREQESEKRFQEWRATHPEPKIVAVEPEVEGDFNARLTRLSDEAQAQAFAQLRVKSESPFNDLPHELVTQGWLCPKHGAQSLNKLTSRKGREYTACKVAGCTEFEK